MPVQASHMEPSSASTRSQLSACSGEEEGILDVALRARRAAEEAKEAADENSTTPEIVRSLLAKALNEATAVVNAARSSPTARSSPRSQSRPTVKEFATALGQEAREVAENAAQESFEYTERSLRKARSLIEDHFNIDEAFRMLGPVRQDSNLARDVHDYFNLAALIPVILFNVWNWSWSAIHDLCSNHGLCGLAQGIDLPRLWHGDVFMLFWWTTFAYFIADLTWMLVLPGCVKSPSVIIQHHVATLAYMMVPYLLRQYGWLMGSCMIVEVNTWFLIARRSFNKNGDKPFQTGVPLKKSVRLIIVSTCFYLSWFAIRLILYPLLFVVICREWLVYSGEVNSMINIMSVTPPMQLIFICLNVKWTIDLVRSKCKGRGASKGL